MPPVSNQKLDLNEFETRRQKIDVLLREQGWQVEDRSRVIIEVDTKQSDFRVQNYKNVTETLKNDLESKYADYLLLDGFRSPIAIIEAKRTFKDPIVTAQKQAAQYADDIKAQMGRDVFVFLSNGHETWFWDRERYGPRKVMGFFSQKDLERLRFQVERVQDILDVGVDTSIVDRTKSIEITKRVIEHIQKGERKALVVMATGTGKTRVAIAIVDILLRTNRAQKVLFLADRKALRDQAYNKGFKKFLPEESRSKILSGNFDKESRLYVSTIQTFQEIYNKCDREGCHLISPAEFDVVISDEAHRSIYNKWNDIFKYLDAIQIGLTATPSDLVDRDTFRFFNCHDGSPTALYDYEDAVKDGVLCDFRSHVASARTHFQVKGIKAADLTPGEVRRLAEEGKDPDEIDFEGTDLEKKVAVKGTSEAIVREFMDNCLMDRSGNLPAKSIFFAVSKKHARRLLEAFNDLYPEYKGLIAEVIVSDSSRASDSIKDFEDKDWPRVAISVDMLDTGIDVPEVCNLVFAKPVISKIKFWQMLGRGTRSDGTCSHREWLPYGRKEYFKVFDFWNNFERQNMQAKPDQRGSQEAINSRIFMLRLKQLSHLMDLMQKVNGAEAIDAADAAEVVKATEAVKEKVLEDVDSLPRDSVSVKERIGDVETALSARLWDNVGLDPVEFLRDQITPLMRFKPGTGLNESNFTLKCERLGLAALEDDEKEIERLKPEIGKMINSLPRTLDVVKRKERQMDEVLSHRFWNGVSFEDSQMLIEELSGLMRYMSPEPREIIVIDMEDPIEERSVIQFGPDATEEYVGVYKRRVEERIKNLTETHPAVKKINRGEALDEADLLLLEETLNSPELYITEGVLQEVYETRSGTLVQFIKKVLGLYEFADPEARVMEAFQGYIRENNKRYSADQLSFIRTIQTVFARKRHLEYADLFDAPFSNFGVRAPMPLFTEAELKSFIGLCKSLEWELFAEA